MITRRALLASAAAMPALAACSHNPTTGTISIDPAFVDQVISIVRSGCGVFTGYFPTVSSVAAVVAGFFGPAAVATVQGIAGSVETVATALCAAAAPQPTSMRLAGKLVTSSGARGGPAALAGRLGASSPTAPVVIGKVTVGGKPITVQGYR